MTDGEIERKILRHEIWIEKILNIQKKQEQDLQSSYSLICDMRRELIIFTLKAEEGNDS